MNSLGDQIRSLLKTPPRKFQVRGVRFLIGREGRAIIGDDMGLGKTYQTIAYLQLHPEIRPAVIICPASLKYNWQREFDKHADMDAEVLEGTRPGRLSGKLWIINYDILGAWMPKLLAAGVQCAVLDECHRVKNRKAKRTQAAKVLTRVCPHVIGLSGTPIVNGPVEFFPILQMVAPKDFKSFTDYAFRYCGPKQGFGGHWDFRGASNLAELHRRISPYMLRRSKAEVLPELPKKTRTVIPVKIPMKEYNRARDLFIDWLTENKGAEAAKRARGAEALVKLGQLKQLAAWGKLKAIKEWVADWREDAPDQKLVVFAVHKSVVAALVAAFPEAVVITGDVGLKARQKIVDRFQNDPNCWLFVGNIRAAGEGITLTASSTVAMVEVGWTPAEHDQAEDRVLRIGQTAAHVDAYYFVAKGTVEEQIMELIDAKRDVVGKVLDGVRAGMAVSTKVIEGLLSQRKARK